MRWRMQHSVLIKWHSILRPELNATLHHPLRRGSSYKLLPIAPPAVMSTIRHDSLNALLVNSTLDCIVSLYLRMYVYTTTYLYNNIFNIAKKKKEN